MIQVQLVCDRQLTGNVQSDILRCRPDHLAERLRSLAIIRVDDAWIEA